MLLCAKVHYAKVEPYDRSVLKASVSGLVTEAVQRLEGSVVEGKRIVHLDDALEIKDLNATQKSIALLEETLRIDRQMAALLEKSSQRQEGYFHRLEKLPTASQTQKDSAFSAYVSVKNQYLATKEKITVLQRQLIDMQYKAARLKDTIAKKSLVLHHRYLYRLMVRKGDFVAPGTPLATVDDMTRAKLVLYLSPEEAAHVSQERVFLNDKATSYRVTKVWRVADEKYISSYRAEIYIDAPKTSFSQLVKVELK